VRSHGTRFVTNKLYAAAAIRESGAIRRLAVPLSLGTQVEIPPGWSEWAYSLSSTNRVPWLAHQFPQDDRNGIRFAIALPSLFHRISAGPLPGYLPSCHANDERARLKCRSILKSRRSTMDM